jgi:type I restriction enzyme, S subunit
MRPAWPTVKLGEVLKEHDNSIPAAALPEVNLAGVYSFGRGLFKRGPMSPGDTSYKYYNRLVTDDFVISVPKAWEGALARVTREFEGWFLSPVFPTFRPDRARLIPEFLEWYCKRESVWGELQRKSRGIGARRESVHPQQFLSLEIPLPPLAEQRRVLARLENLAAQTHEARTLRHQATEDAGALLVALAHRADLDESAKHRAGWQRKRLSDVIQFVDDSHKVTPDTSYPNLGIYSFGRGLFHKPPIDGLATSATALRRVKAGQFIYSRLFAFEGAYGAVTPEFDGAFVSQEYPTFDCHPERVRSQFLAAYFKPAHVWKAVAAGSKGLGDRRQRVQPAQVLAHELWLPPLAWQNRLAEVQAEVDALKPLQAETAAELDALLPSILDRAFKGDL